MTVDVVERLLRAGAGRARRRAETMAAYGAALAAEELPGVRAEADADLIRLRGRRLARRVQVAEFSLARWIEGLRAAAGGLR